MRNIWEITKDSICWTLKYILLLFSVCRSLTSLWIHHCYVKISTRCTSGKGIHNFVLVCVWSASTLPHSGNGHTENTPPDGLWLEYYCVFSPSLCLTAIGWWGQMYSVKGHCHSNSRILSHKTRSAAVPKENSAFYSAMKMSYCSREENLQPLWFSS